MKTSSTAALLLVTIAYSTTIQAATFTRLGDLPGGIFESFAHSISADGTVVVGESRTSNGIEAFRWTMNSGMVGLGDLSGGVFLSRANGVSADGSVIVGSGTNASGTEAFRWTMNDGMVGLGDFPGSAFESTAQSISGDGSIIVGRGTGFSDRREAYRWTASSGLVGLGDLTGGVFESSALGISADGSVIVGQSASVNGDEAFVWDATSGIRNLRDILINDFNLDLSGWLLEEASAISSDGTTIVGSGINPSGNFEAWIATISAVPEPTTLTLFNICLIPLATCRQRYS